MIAPGELRAESFARYPPQARLFAVANLPVLQRMPLILIALVLRQAIQYDWCFPAEREQLSRQLDLVGRMDAASFDALMAPFSAIQLSPELRGIDWVREPQQFSERLTAYLWSQNQIDRYHEAAQRYPSDGLEVLLTEIRSRAQQYPLEYGHWYIEGGELHAGSKGVQGLTVMSYARLVPAAKREFALLNQFTNRAGGGGKVGVEAVSSYVAGLNPDDLGLKGTPADDALRHFEVNVLTQGAGCQIYSTTFVQWASRECLHRAQPLTLFARFATRQRSAPMEQLLARDPLQQPQDPEGSLTDADMGAYYTWINQSRLAGADQSRFLVWFEGHGVVCAVSPTLPRGTTSTASVNMRQVLDWMR